MPPPFLRPARAPGQPPPGRSTVPFDASQASQGNHRDAVITGLYHRDHETTSSRAQLPSLLLWHGGNQTTLPRRVLSDHSVTRAQLPYKTQDAGYEPSIPSRQQFVNSRLGQQERDYDEPALHLPHGAIYAEQSQTWAGSSHLTEDYEVTRMSNHHFDDSPFSRQGTGHCREPLRNFSRTQLPWRLPLEAQQPYHTSRDPPSPVKVNNRAGSSVVSPFFKRNDAPIQMAASDRPPTRGSVSSERRSARPYGRDRGSRAPGSVQPESQRYLPLYEQQLPSCQSTGTGNREAQPWTTSLPRRQLATAPYTPRNFTRSSAFEAPPYPQDAAPFYAPQSRQAGMGMSQTTALRSRITLPTSAGRTQDMELASVPGVRGASSQQRGGSSFLQHRGPVYQDSRPLFSAAGRRSVRR